MTREELETSLAKIGWSIYKSENGLNDYIVNDKNITTSFVVGKANRLEIRQDLFGKTSFSGNVHFELSDITISEGSGTGKEGVIDYVALNFSENCFIQFFKDEK